MLTAVLLACALVAGAHPVALAALGLAIVDPGWFLAAAGGWAVYSRWRARRSPPGPAAEAAFLQSMAAELSAGASLRGSLDAAADRAPELDLARAVRLAAAGRPATEVGRQLERALPLNGRLTGAGYRLASRTGGRAAVTFAALAARAIDAGESARERRAATAQARLSAWVVGLAPLVVLGLLAATGRLGALFSSGTAGYVILAGGVSMELAGGVLVWSMLRSAER